MIDIFCHFSKNVLRTQTQSFKSSQLNSTTTKIINIPQTTKKKFATHFINPTQKTFYLLNIMRKKR